MTYQKIPTVFKRNPKNPKQFTDEYSTPELAALASAPVWRFTEKVDGTNIQMMWDGYRVTFQGRTETSEIPKHFQEYLDERYGTPEFENLMEETFGTKIVTIYGEGYGDRIQAVGQKYLGEGNNAFIAFDIEVDGYYLAAESTQGALASIGIDMVPEYEGIKTLDEAIAFVKTNPKSRWGDFPMEGLVGVTRLGLLNKRRERIIVKVKNRDFAS